MHSVGGAHFFADVAVDAAVGLHHVGLVVGEHVENVGGAILDAIGAAGAFFQVDDGFFHGVPPWDRRRLGGATVCGSEPRLLVLSRS